MQRFMPDLKACTPPLTSPFVLCNTDSFCETPNGSLVDHICFLLLLKIVLVTEEYLDIIIGFRRGEKSHCFWKVLYFLFKSWNL